MATTAEDAAPPSRDAEVLTLLADVVFVSTCKYVMLLLADAVVAKSLELSVDATPDAILIKMA